MTVRKSLGSSTHIISMIDGKPYQTLKRHLSKHDLTPEQYRERYGLPKTYPMVAPAYSESRREIAKKLGLGNRVKGAQDQAAPPAPANEAPAAETAPAPAKRKPAAPKVAKPAPAKVATTESAKTQPKAPAKPKAAPTKAKATPKAAAIDAAPDATPPKPAPKTRKAGAAKTAAVQARAPATKPA